jgi:hypothetical protein
MFDTIQRNNSNTTDWTFLLLQLVTSGIVDAQSNKLVLIINVCYCRGGSRISS